MATPGPMTSDRPYTSQYWMPSFLRMSSRMLSEAGSAPKMPAEILKSTAGSYPISMAVSAMSSA